jgi:mannose-1-phosphate guanylyltransferase/mannose-6-phosphate isomerase
MPSAPGLSESAVDANASPPFGALVVRDTARVTVGDAAKLVQENESVYITATHWHRLENPGKVPLEIIEVQFGTYLGEDDIVRADEVDNRGPDKTK